MRKLQHWAVLVLLGLFKHAPMSPVLEQSESPMLLSCSYRAS
jgi:hypothetical protein